MTPTETIRQAWSAAREPRAATRTGWTWLRRRVHPVRGVATVGWLLGWLLVCRLWPAVIAAVQSSQWCIRWQQGVVDRVAKPWVQACSVAWLTLWMWFVGPWSTWTHIAGAPAVVAVVFGVGRLTYRHTTRGRARGRYRADAGWPTWLDLRATVSAHATRRKTFNEDLRPDLAPSLVGRWSGRPSAWRIARTPVLECGSYLGAVDVGLPWPSRIYTDWRSNKLVVGPTGAAKTRQVIDHDLLDFPGAAVSMQTSGETYARTARARARRGPVYIVDPHGLTGGRSDVAWDPVPGCRVPATAIERASTMAGNVGHDIGDNQEFLDRAAILLRTMLLTADVADLDMATVYRWASSDLAGLLDAVEVMQRPSVAARIPAGWVDSMKGILSSKADRRVAGVLTYLAACVEWMSDPVVAALATPGRDAPPFDVARFIADRGTLYLIAENREHGAASPYLAALCDYIWHEAKRLAADRPGRRHSPPLGLFNDEGKNGIVLPLKRLATDSAKYGIFVESGFQSRKQLYDLYGRDGGDEVWTGFVAKMIAGGITDESELTALSTLCGAQPGRDREGREQPKLTPDAIRRIPRGVWLVIERSTPVALTRTRDVGRRPEVLAARALPAPTVSRAAPRVIDAAEPVDAPALEAPEPRDQADDREEAGVR